MKITPSNLLKNLHKIGPWSTYGLAVTALEHYFPEAYHKYEPMVWEEVELLTLLGLEYFEDVVIKYHKEVGYKGEFNSVNEY